VPCHDPCHASSDGSNECVVTGASRGVGRRGPARPTSADGCANPPRPAERSRFGSAAGPGWANPACARPAGSTLGGVSGERGQTWYPIGKVGCLSRHIRENLGVTAGQPCLLQPALAQPGWLDDASVAGIIGLRQGQAGDLVPFRDQAGRWHAVPGLSPPRRAAVWECEAASDELGRRRAGVLAAAGQLKPVTMEALIARSGSWLRGAA